MAQTMSWLVVPGGSAVVVVMKEVKPSDEDWDACLKEIESQDGKIKGVLVYSTKEGPSAPQRARNNEVFQRMESEVLTAIMTTSRMVRGMVTALTWALGGKIKAFSTKELDEAVTFLGLDENERLSARVALRQAARAANVVIDAFADESGQFQKKYL